MTDLSRSLLSAARDGLTPDAAVAARVRAKVAASIAAGAGTAGAAAAASSAAASTPAVAPVAARAGSKSLLLKLGALLVVAGGITTAVIATSGHSSDAPRLSMSTTFEVDEPRTADRTVARDDEPHRSDQAPTSAHALHASDAARPAAVDPSEIEIEVPPPAPTAEPVSLSREVELIDLAMASLRKHAPAAALAAIRTYEHETLGQGQMAEEAAAIAIEARCGLHQDVTDDLAAFDRAWPSSAQRSRVVTTCFAR